MMNILELSHSKLIRLVQGMRANTRVVRRINLVRISSTWKFNFKYIFFSFSPKVKIKQCKNYCSLHFLGEAICSVYIQPEGFGPPAQQLTDSYKKEFTQSIQSSEQKMQTGNQVFQQRSYQQTVDKRSYVNGTTTSIEDFKVL